MPKTLRDSALALAQAHRRNDPATLDVYLAADPDEREIRLVEVVGELTPAGEVLPVPLRRDPSKGIDFPSVLILLSPEEWESCKRGDLELPWGRPEDLERIA